MTDLEKTLKGLECCSKYTGDECQHCPYEPVCNPKPGERNPLMMDAITLLKAYQPHVMTLEETKKNSVIWLENYTDPAEGVEPVIRPAIIESAKNGGFLVIDSEETDDNDGLVWLSESDYGKEWRPWSDMPTIKQREAVPWQ